MPDIPDTRHAGSKPQSTVVTAQMPAAKTSARQSSDRSS